MSRADPAKVFYSGNLTEGNLFKDAIISFFILLRDSFSKASNLRTRTGCVLEALTSPQPRSNRILAPSIAITGWFVAGNTYANYFNPIAQWWQNSSSPITFDLKSTPEAWYESWTLFRALPGRRMSPACARKCAK